MSDRDTNGVGLSDNHKQMSTTGKALDKARSTQNYRMNKETDKMKEVRKYAFTLVYSWTTQEKQQLIGTYGAGHLLRPNMSEGELNEALVETMIVTLPQAELFQIMAQAKTKNVKMINDMKAASKKSVAIATKTTQRFKNDINNVRTDSNNTIIDAQQSRMEILSKYNPYTPTKLPSGAAKIENSINKQMDGILKLLSPIELKQRAVRMNLEVDGQTSTSDVKKLIKNFVAMYVYFTDPKNKDKNIPLFDPTAVDEAKKFVELTSFGPMGRANSELVKELRKEHQERIARYNSTRPVKGKKRKLANKKDVESKYGSKDDLEHDDDGFLKGKTRLELIDIAAEMDIVDTNKWSTGLLKYNIYREFETRNKELKIQAKQNKKAAKKRWFRKQRKNDIAYRDEELNVMMEAQERIKGGNAFNQTKSSWLHGAKTPTPSMNGISNIPTVSIVDGRRSEIDTAVPVWIMGKDMTNEEMYSKAAQYGLDIKKDSSEMKESLDAFRENMGKDLEKNAKSKRGIQRYFEGKVEDLWKINVLNKSALISGVEEVRALIDSYPVNTASEQAEKYGDYIRGRIGTLEKQIRSKTTTGTHGRGGAYKKAHANRDNFSKVRKQVMEDDNRHNNEMILAQLVRKDRTEKNNSGISALPVKFENDISKSSNLTNMNKYLNAAAQKLPRPNKSINKTQTITPVYITNGFTEYLTTVTKGGFEELISSSGAIGSYLTSMLPLLFVGLQSIGVAVNAASVSSVAQAVIGAAGDALTATVSAALTNGISDVSGISKFATGGTGSAGDRISQIITGDSLNDRPNPELVTMNWDKKQFEVKPMANDNSGSNINNVSRMTSSDRSSAMKVTFANALMKYKEPLQDVEDDIDNLALKVYPVRNILDDKIDVGDGNMVSAIDLMVSMNSSLIGIQALMAAGATTGGTTVINNSGGSGLSAKEFPSSLDSILGGN